MDSDTGKIEDTQVIKIVDILKQDRDVLFAYLFGSQARGLTHPSSDIDIAVFLKSSDQKFCLRKEDELSKEIIISLGTDKVDMVILNVAGIELRCKVITQGKNLILKDEMKRIDFEVKTLLDYFDLKPYLDEYDSYLLERISTRSEND